MKYGTLTLGQIEALVNKMGGMYAVKDFLSGYSQIIPKEHIVDLDAAAPIPGVKLKCQNGGGKWKLDPEKIRLWSPDRLSSYTHALKVAECLEQVPEIETAFNANLLFYFLDHREMIPEEFRGKAVIFPGTSCTDAWGHVCAPVLHEDSRRGYEGTFCWTIVRADDLFLGNYRVALRLP